MKSCTPFESNLNLAKYYPGSSKIYQKANLYPEMQVAMRLVSLTNGINMPLYDTSGIYTAPGLTFDITKGLPENRKKHYLEVNPLTQLAYAKKGVITPSLHLLMKRLRN